MKFNANIWKSVRPFIFPLFLFSWISKYNFICWTNFMLDETWLALNNLTLIVYCWDISVAFCTVCTQHEVDIGLNAFTTEHTWQKMHLIDALLFEFLENGFFRSIRPVIVSKYFKHLKKETELYIYTCHLNGRVVHSSEPFNHNGIETIAVEKSKTTPICAMQKG